MHKSKLQELCQRESWELPEYATAKDGPDHMPRFTATATVCGQVFETPAHCKSSKEAQNTAARVAFDSLSAPPPPPPSSAPSPPPSSAPSPPPLAACSDAPLCVAEPPRIQPLSITPYPPPLPLSPFPSSLPDPPPALLATKCNADTKPVKEELLLKEEILQENADDQSQCSIDYKIATGSVSKAEPPRIQPLSITPDPPPLPLSPFPSSLPDPPPGANMYKSKLQELCQRESWELPEYATAKDGPDHMPRFTATITVCGQVFENPAHCKSSKEAQNTAARVAFDSLSAPPPPSAAPSPPTLAACSDFPLHVAEPPRIQPLSITPDPPPLPLSPFPSSLPDPPPGANMYKSKLQELCQRESWELPEYATAKDGPNHMPRFTATVTVCGQVFETPAHCKSSKEAQNTAARVAFNSLSAPPPPPSSTLSPPPSSAPSPPTLAACSDFPLHVAEPPRIQPLSITPDTPPLPLSPFPSSLPNPPPGANIYKSKLQELCQRESWELPEYATAKDGPDHMPRFTATVTVCGQFFETPAHCKSSKEAQNTAARVAFDSLSAPPPPPPSSAPSPPTLAACSDAPLHVAEPPRIQPLSITPDPPPLPLSHFPSSLPDLPPGVSA